MKERLGNLTLTTGDVLVLQGSRSSLTAMLQDFRSLPLAQREVLLGSVAVPSFHSSSWYSPWPSRLSVLRPCPSPFLLQRSAWSCCAPFH